LTGGRSSFSFERHLNRKISPCTCLRTAAGAAARGERGRSGGRVSAARVSAEARHSNAREAARPAGRAVGVAVR